jgi:hypothetical protein
MTARTYVHIHQVLCALVFVAVAVVLVRPVMAGIAGLRNSAVGGISIDVEGVVGPPVESAQEKMLTTLREEIKSAPAEMAAPVKLRMISLQALNRICEEAARTNFGQLPDEVRFLAGLQRIQYIFLYPEENDIVLAGPGEGWRVDDNANVVGITTGRPVMRLDDLLVALRFVQVARTEGISCSIDPTDAGNRALQQVLDQQRRSGNLNPSILEPAMKQAFGPQQVKIAGVPASSHFARVLVAADYRMKRIAMHLDKSPVSDLPSYLELLQTSRKAAGVNPRWWIACDYQPLAASEDQLAWELRGPGVQVKTEDELTTADGSVRGTGRTSTAAQRWANLMTEHYDALSVEDGVFGELRNLMDMCVVAAVIAHHGLATKAGLSIPLLTDPRSALQLEEWHAPKQVAPEVSFLRTRGSWIVTASGGVQIESWQAASRTENVANLGQVRAHAGRSAGSFWWQ